MLSYPAKAKKVKDGYKVTFRDFPDVFFICQTRDEIESKATKFVVDHLKDFVRMFGFLPSHGFKNKDEISVDVPITIETKLRLYIAMYNNAVSPTELAKRMNIHPQEITRILRLTHNTKIDTMAKAFKAIGYTLEIKVV